MLSYELPPRRLPSLWHILLSGVRVRKIRGPDEESRPHSLADLDQHAHPGPSHSTTAGERNDEANPCAW
jgi:hypothetical protein